MARSEPHLAILGAGLAGIEAALWASHLRLRFAVYERGALGQHLYSRGMVRMLTPWSKSVSSLGLESLHTLGATSGLPADLDYLIGREFREIYLVPLCQSPQLQPHLHSQTTVLRIGRCHSGRFRLLLRSGEGQERYEEADFVLDCTGIYGNPRFLGEGGIPALGELALRDQFAWGIEDILGDRKNHYVDRNILLIGSGLTAATNITLLAELARQHPSTWVTWIARGANSTPLKRVVNDPLRERDALFARANQLATRGEGNIEFRPKRTVEHIESHGKDNGYQVHFQGEKTPLEVDRIIANVGYRPDDRLADALGSDRNGYFVLGMKGQAGMILPHQLPDMLRECFAKILGRKVELPRLRRA
jgi:thioredoxin reductase